MTDLSPDLPRDPRHDPVLREEVIAALAIAPGERHVDATFGAGGYTRAMLAAGAEVIACDRDPDAIAEGQALVAEADGRLTLLHGRFGEIDQLLADRGIAEVDGITFDIGVSSMQLDRGARVTELLKQPQYSPLSISLMAASLFAVNKGYMDDIEVKQVLPFEHGLHAFLKDKHAALLQKMEGGKALDKDKEAEGELTSAIEAFKKSFA